MSTVRFRSGGLQRSVSAFRDGIAAATRKGVSRASRWYDRWLKQDVDARFGVDTSGIDDDLAGHGAQGEHLSQAEGYEPIQPNIFRAILHTSGIDPARYVFVDYGSGKGRALILAAEHRFQRMIGVELAPGLHEMARRNIAIYLAHRRAPRCSFDLVCGDAVAFALPPEDAFLFLYNPFGEIVLRKVVANIERSWLQRPRDLVIAYRNPVCAHVFEERGFLQRMAANRSFALYRSSNNAQPQPQ